MPPSSTVPLFVDSLQKLKSSLRMSTVGGSGTDGGEVLEAAIESVRVKIYDILGDTLVDQILATAPTASPTTALQIRRMRASLVEIDGVRAELMATEHVIVQSAAAATRQISQDDGSLRFASHTDQRRAIEAMQARFANGLHALSAAAASPSSFHVSTIESLEKIIYPGDSLRVGDGYGE